jgi:serine/threonine-protein kinase RsbT
MNRGADDYITKPFDPEALIASARQRLERRRSIGEEEIARLPIAGIEDIVTVRLVIRQQAARIGFTAQALTQIATSVSGIARNVVQHAGSAGRVRLFEAWNSGRPGLKIVVSDKGPGIADLDRALAGTSPGAGIPRCRKLMDEMAIQSSAETGTEVTMTKWTAL